MAQTIKNPPAMQETWVQFLCCEDPLEKGMATYSSVLAWGVPETGGWWVAVWVTESGTRLRDFHFTV